MKRQPVGVLALVAATVAALLWLGPADAQRAKPPKADAEAGERIYKNNCILCHGAAGHGDGAAGARLNPKPADLTSAATQAKPDAELLETLKFGRPGTAMVGWMSDIDEREMRDLLAYIRTLASR
jgi:high-affinity iron transporter